MCGSASCYPMADATELDRLRWQGVEELASALQCNLATRYLLLPSKGQYSMVAWSEQTFEASVVLSCWGYAAMASMDSSGPCSHQCGLHAIMIT